MAISQITASELYEAVWQTPLKKLADQWQLHPHALGQTLDKHNIPRPPNGYWTQKAVGKKVSITPLPEHVSANRLIDLTTLQATKREKTKVLPTPLPPPKKTLGRYQLLKGIKSSLKKPYHQYDFVLSQDHDNTSVLRLDVSAEQRDRAISILHSLMSAFEERGWPVKVVKLQYEKRLMNIVMVDETDIRFRLRERLKQQKRELTEKEQQEKARKEWVWKENINVPSGILQLYIDGPLPRGMKSLFEDRAKLSLEEQLGTFVDCIKESAAHSKVLAEERLIRDREWKEEQIRREKLEAAISNEQFRIREFLAMFGQWQKAHQCRQFIAEVASSEAFLERDEEQREHWKAWAASIADSIDPLQSKTLEQSIESHMLIENSLFEKALTRVLGGNKR